MGGSEIATAAAAAHAAGPPAWVAVAGFVLAIVAFAVSLASLTWNIVSWRWSGPRVKVELRRRRGARLNPQPEKYVEELDITAMNGGRLPVRVQQVWLRRRNPEWWGVYLGTPMLLAESSDSLPELLANGARLRWTLDLLALRKYLSDSEFLDEKGQPISWDHVVVVEVRLSTGQVATAQIDVGGQGSVRVYGRDGAPLDLT